MPDRILIARRARLGRSEGMGAKYLPSDKDRKAGQRFLQRQRPLPKFAKPTGPAPAKKGRKK